MLGTALAACRYGVSRSSRVGSSKVRVFSFFCAVHCGLLRRFSGTGLVPHTKASGGTGTAFSISESGDVVNTVTSSAFIHPTAIVHPKAIIGEGVNIGPFCTVGSGVKLGAGCKLQPGCHISGNTEFGEFCSVLSGAVIGDDVPGKTVIGKSNRIGYHAVIGVKCQDLKYKSGEECFLRIGDNNDIREHASVHLSSKDTDVTIIGNNNLIMGSCHVGHDVKLGNNNILANGTLLGGHVVLENFVHTGGGVAVHQFCHVDSYAFLAAGSMVDRDVPMYMMVAGDRAVLRGLNVEGLRRHRFADSEVKIIRRIYQKLFINRHPHAGGLEDRLARLESDEELTSIEAAMLMLKSIRGCLAGKRRGICKTRDLGENDLVAYREEIEERTTDFFLTLRRS